ncbi:MAG TPA: phosphoribosylformylglycinamidine synthase subunit PurQ [Chitinophagales bacterium]|jgi:phosphoribosylformylglycinamidine synthase|nr:phosphoribosylformylglycinamidine synthase subunit PurQ [Chitinophagales bacterium]
MKFGVVVFPGSNCDRDVIHVCQNVMQTDTRILWHKDTDLQDLTTEDCIMIPGGFSYGDYLRCGAIARFSPIMEKVIAHANNGGYVWGICNGFQVLCESHLLPGALLRNEQQRFICQNQYIIPQTNQSAITKNLDLTEALNVPIAHGEGRYFADEKTLQQLKQNDQVLFKYCDEQGNITAAANPNGSVDNIAGICNAGRNVFGMMPHPERSAEEVLGNTDGRKLFESLMNLALA